MYGSTPYKGGRGNMKSFKMWMIQDPQGALLSDTLRKTRKNAIWAEISYRRWGMRLGDMSVAWMELWRILYRSGYRAVRMRLEKM